MAMISVAEALERVLAAVEAPLEAEEIAIGGAIGRTLANDVVAVRDQPPFAASAMDGYAAREADLSGLPVTLHVVGTSAAGRRHRERIGEGEAVRIFTGAPLPEGSDAIVIQEDTEAGDGVVTILAKEPPGRYIRPSGLDFRAGDVLLRAGDRLDARRITLAAAAGFATLSVRRKPRVAILATGDELVRPGETPAPDQIHASNPFGVRAIVERAGGEVIDLGIAADNLDDLAARIASARDTGADLLVTLGGASVGEHDLVQKALVGAGMELGFWRVALRPGKPLMHGRLGRMLLLGLPGNPVSSLVCSVVFIVPAIRAFLGDPSARHDPTEKAVLGTNLSANDERQDYLRASLERAPDGGMTARAHNRQDSSMMAVMAASEALIVRSPSDPARTIGTDCMIIRLDRFV